MHVISRKILRDYCQSHTDARDALYDWYRVASKARWLNLTEVQATYKTAEAVGNFTVFNIKGNRYRSIGSANPTSLCDGESTKLIVDIIYEQQRIYIKYVLTHAEYDKDRWKNDPYY